MNAPPAVATCYIVSDWLQEPYGTEALAVMAAESLARRGWRVRIFTLDYDPATCVWADRLRSGGVRVTAANFRLGRRWLLPHRWLARRAWAQARVERPRFVYAPTNDLLVIETILSRPGNLEIPCFVHDPSEGGDRFPSYHRSWATAVREVSGVSVHGSRQLIAVRSSVDPPCPLAVVWPATLAPTSVGLRAPRDAPLRFGILGRLHAGKGGDFAVAAFARLRAEGRAAELHFYGDGPDGDRLASLARSLGVAAEVRFHGRYSYRDLDEIATRIDVAVLASIYEGFGLVILEMMSRGVPVISTDVGSSHEVLVGLGGGWVCARADTESLASAMMRCCDEPDVVSATGRTARRVWAEYFTPERMVDRYLDFWRSCTPQAFREAP
jgi:glycosyltransferase involved in cell wall biosynthesis